MVEGQSPTAHNLVAVFGDMTKAQQAFGALQAAGFETGQLALVGRDNKQVEGESDRSEEVANFGFQTAEAAGKGGLLGGAAGSIVGFIVGALAFGIPGIGPAVGVGLWAAIAGMGAAGATTGGMIGAFRKLWDIRYRDLVAAGHVLVSVHVDDQSDVERALQVLSTFEPKHLEEFDHGGALRHDYSKPSTVHQSDS